MQRRKFILGLGATTAGGSALLGSGAFTSVQADRDVAVDVVGDDEAFLRLGACTDGNGDPKPNGAYVFQGEDGLFSVSLSGDNENDRPAGSGVNQNAVSTFHNVFEMCNQGTQEVCVDFAVDALPVIPNGTDVPDRYDFEDGDLAVTFYRGDDPDDPINVANLEPDRDGAFPIGVGECQCVGIEVRAFGFDSEEDLFEDTELQIVADAEAECSNNPPEERPNEPGEELEEVYADSVVDGRTTQGETKTGGDIKEERTDPENALDEPDGEFFSLGFRPDGADWDWDGGGRLTVEFDEENELVKRPYDTDVLNVETTNNRDDYPEELALVEVAGPGTDGEYVEIGTATSKASNGINTFELPAQPITKVRLTDETDPGIHNGQADGFDVEAIGGYSETQEN